MKLSWKLFAAAWVVILLGAALANAIQTSGGIKVEKVAYPGETTTISAMLYTPPNATPERKAPAVMVSHGLINTREMQSAFAIELARRGFVVLAIDMTGHGYSGGALRSDGYGGPASLRYLRSLPFVDANNIGLEGHSMGGAPVQAAAAAEPDGYKAMVLEGSSTLFGGARGAASGGAGPRNLAIVFGQFDEFAQTMWGTPKGSEIGAGERMRRLFRSEQPVEPGRVYGDIAQGTARIWLSPAVNHPGEHFSNDSVGGAVDWFMRTLDGEANPLPVSDQIWFWKDVGTGLAFAGFIMLLLGSFELALSTPWLAGMRLPADPAGGRDWRWWITLAATAIIPAATYFTFMGLGAQWLKSSALLPQSINNQLVVWALLNGAISLVLGFVLSRGKSRARIDVLGSAIIALAVVAIGYASLALVDAIFNVDYRFWVLALKPLDERRLVAFLTYLPLFLVFFLVSIRALNLGLGVSGEKFVSAVLTSAVAMSIGFVGLLAIQYVPLFTTGRMTWPDQPLNTIVAYQFVPVLASVGLIAAWTYRRTNSWLPGALISALFVTWYVVSGTAFYPPAAAQPAAAATATPRP